MRAPARAPAVVVTLLDAGLLIKGLELARPDNLFTPFPVIGPAVAAARLKPDGANVVDDVPVNALAVAAAPLDVELLWALEAGVP